MTFDTTPKPKFLLAMQNHSWTVAGALSELVDNSFGSGRGDAERVVITHDVAKGTIEVLDNGRGLDELGRLFQLGNTIGRSPGDIGLYGSGGTMALLWLAREVRIWTLRDGMVSKDSVNWKKQIKEEEFPLISSEWSRASINNTPHELLDCEHGTLIRLYMQPEKKISVSNVTKELAATYSPAFRMGRELIWKTIGRNGTERALVEILPSLNNIYDFDGIITIDGIELTFQGQIGTVEDLPHAKSVVSIAFGPRVITTTRDCFASPGGDEIYAGTGVCGHLDLGEGWQPFLATTKNRIHDDRAWDALMAHVFETIQPLLKKLQAKKLNLILDDLAVQLEEAFDGKGEIEIQVKPKKPGEPTGKKHPHGPPEKPGTDEPLPPGTDEQTTSAATVVVVVPQTDAELGGALCAIQDVGGQFLILVNEEHPDVKAAMDARPTNRLALMLLINNEIASLAARDEQFRKRLFKNRHNLLDRINAFQDGWGGSFICRLLMDRVRRQREVVIA